MRKIRLAKLDIVTNYKNTEKAGVIKVMRRKICDGIWVLRDEEEEKVGFAEKKLRLWGIEAIDTIDAIDAIDTIEAIEGVEGIVWGIFLNRGTVPCQIFLVGVGGGEKK